MSEREKRRRLLVLGVCLIGSVAAGGGPQGAARLAAAAPPAASGRYAVLVVANQTTSDTVPMDADWWHDLIVQYQALKDDGFADEDISVVYGAGSDFQSQTDTYSSTKRFKHNITTLPLTFQGISDAFAAANSRLRMGGYLYVAWSSHGTQVSGSNPCEAELYLEIAGTQHVVSSSMLKQWVQSVTQAGRITLSVNACSSGQVGELFAGVPGTIVLTAAQCGLNSFDISDDACNQLPASEFSYFQTEALRQKDICDKGVSSDINGDGRVSFDEVAQHLCRMQLSKPQVFDPFGIAKTTSLKGAFP